MIDTHAHLDSPGLRGRVPEILATAAQAGVHTVISIGADLASSRAAVELASGHERLFATVGVHPHDADTVTPATLEEIRTLSHAPKVVAIGEIGLDYYRNLSPRDAQVAAFTSQLRLAIERALPVVVHTRESFDDAFAIAREYAPHLPGGVFHCFPGTAAEAEKLFAIGFVVSVGGVITYKNASMADMAREVPLEKLMLETDAPYLTPVPHRGKTNSPEYLPLIAEKLADLRSITVDQVSQVTDRVAEKLFRLSPTFAG